MPESPFPYCLAIHGVSNDGEPLGSKSWAMRLAYGYQHIPGIVLAGNRVLIHREFWEANPIAFDHLMSFADIHNLKVTFRKGGCAECVGYVAGRGFRDRARLQTGRTVCAASKTTESDASEINAPQQRPAGVSEIGS